MEEWLAAFRVGILPLEPLDGAVKEEEALFESSLPVEMAAPPIVEPGIIGIPPQSLQLVIGG